MPVLDAIQAATARFVKIARDVATEQKAPIGPVQASFEKDDRGTFVFVEARVGRDAATFSFNFPRRSWNADMQRRIESYIDSAVRGTNRIG